MRPPRAALAAATALLLASAATAQSWLPTSIEPPWANAPVARTIPFTHDPTKSDLQNGALLAIAVDQLVPGDCLVLGPGTYSIQNRFEIFLQGTAQAPIRIMGSDPANRPVITRPDASQNIVNVGLVSGGASRYLVLRDLELTGGSDLIRLYECDDVWIDRCCLHDGGGVGIAANSNDCSYLYITRNEIARPGTSNPNITGEGMYLGQNFGAQKISYSVVAFNHVYETQIPSAAPPYQGDGIELKQGSHHNWIVGNHVHETNYPGILVHGTGDATAPDGENVVERNLVYDAVDNVMQVQGDAFVRNNIVVYSSNGSAFRSGDHQGPSRDIVVAHNTFVSVGRAANLAWGSAPNAVFVNNACYSQTGTGMNFVGGTGTVVVEGNVVFGQVAGASSGFVTGSGIGDFLGASWNGGALNVFPAPGRGIDNRGAWSWMEPEDFLGRPRPWPADPGALFNAPAATADTTAVSSLVGGAQDLALDAGPSHAGERYLLVGSMTGITPPLRVAGYDLHLVVDPWTQVTFGPNTGPLVNTFGTLDAQGRVADVSLVLPPVPGVSLDFWHAFAVFDAASQVSFVSNPVPLDFE